MREKIDQAPSEEFAGRDEHLTTCADCSAYIESALAFDESLRAALAVSVPEFSLPELPAATDDNVVSLSGRHQSSAPRSSKPFAWLAVAASVALAALIGFQFTNQGAEAPNLRPELVAEVLGHMDHERSEMRVKTVPASTARVVYVTESAGSEVADDIGLVSYARSCKINGESIPHLVVQGKQGPVTILIMPNEPIDATVPFADEDFHGAIVPIGTTGSVAIIGRKGESIDDLRESISDKIKLSI